MTPAAIKAVILEAYRQREQQKLCTDGECALSVLREPVDRGDIVVAAMRRLRVTKGQAWAIISGFDGIPYRSSGGDPTFVALGAEIRKEVRG